MGDFPASYGSFLGEGTLPNIPGNSAILNRDLRPFGRRSVKMGCVFFPFRWLKVTLGTWALETCIKNITLNHLALCARGVGETLYVIFASWKTTT